MKRPNKAGTLKTSAVQVTEPAKGNLIPAERLEPQDQQWEVLSLFCSSGIFLWGVFIIGLYVYFRWPAYRYLAGLF